MPHTADAGPPPVAAAPRIPSASEIVAQERHLRHDLGFWSLAAASFGGIMGSGWLFGAQVAGPASLVSWVIAGGTVALVGLVLIELGASRPGAGGSVRWPLYGRHRRRGRPLGRPHRASRSAAPSSSPRPASRSPGVRQPWRGPDRVHRRVFAYETVLNDL